MAPTKITAVVSKRHQRLLIFLLAILILWGVDFSGSEDGLDPGVDSDRGGGGFLSGSNSIKNLFQGHIKKSEDEGGSQKSVTVKRYKPL